MDPDGGELLLARCLQGSVKARTRHIAIQEAGAIQPVSAATMATASSRHRTTRRRMSRRVSRARSAAPGMRALTPAVFRQGDPPRIRAGEAERSWYRHRPRNAPSGGTGRLQHPPRDAALSGRIADPRPSLAWQPTAHGPVGCAWPSGRCRATGERRPAGCRVPPAGGPGTTRAAGPTGATRHGRGRAEARWAGGGLERGGARQEPERNTRPGWRWPAR